MPQPKGGMHSLQEACRITGLTEAQLKGQLAGKGVMKDKVLHFRAELLTPLMRSKKASDDSKSRKGGDKKPDEG